MQAIARVNRVYENKTCGLVIDYVNIFKFMKQALSDYATDDNGDVMPAKDMKELVELLNSSIQEADKFLSEIGINVEQITSESSTLDQLDEIRKALHELKGQAEKAGDGGACGGTAAQAAPDHFFLGKSDLQRDHHRLQRRIHHVFHGGETHPGDCEPHDLGGEGRCPGGEGKSL